MFSDDIKRPNYRDGQYLGPRDFIAEQTYHRDMRRRLSLGQHTWGIYTGMELVEQPREGSATAVDMFISPGLAVDGFGRELVNFAPFKLEPLLFARFTVEQWVEVWIAYETEGTDPPRPGYELCDDPDFAERTRETFRVEVGPRTTPIDPIVIAGKRTPIADPAIVKDGSVPYQALPDDEEAARWLVQLGFVHWDGSSGFIAIQKSTPPNPPTADEEKAVQGRVYGGVVSGHTYAIDNTWELITRRLPPPAGTAPRVEGFVRGRLTVEDLLVAQGAGIELHGGAFTFLTPAGNDNGNPLTLSRTDRGDGGAEIRAQLGTATAGKNRFVFASAANDKVTVADNGTLAILGGRLTIQQTASGDADWGLRVQSDTLQFIEPDDGDRIVFEVLDVGADLGNPVIRLHGAANATLSAEQLIDLTDGGDTILHTHPGATTLAKGMVEIAAAGEAGVNGESGARLVIPANDTRILTQVQKDDLTDGGPTTLHRHPNGILNNVRTVLLWANDSARTDITTVNLGVPKRVVAFITLRAMDPLHDFDRGDGYFADIFRIDGAAPGGSRWSGGDHLGAPFTDDNLMTSVYTGNATSITFRLRTVQDAEVWALGILFFEDI